MSQMSGGWCNRGSRNCVSQGKSSPARHLGERMPHRSPAYRSLPSRIWR